MPKRVRARFTPPSDAEVTAALGTPCTSKATECIAIPSYLEWRTSGAAATFPRLLAGDIRPHDDLDLDPEYPPQPLTEFRTDKGRHAPKGRRSVIYLIALGET